MFRTALLVLATMACAQARPQHNQFKLQPIQFPFPHSAGQSSSTITKGETIDPFGGSSVLVNMQAGTGGEASGGHSNFGTASGSTQGFSGLLGSGSKSETNAQSVQGPGTNVPGFPTIPGFNNFGSATGQANTQLTSGMTTGPHGGVTTITQLGSSATGTAENGASSINKASGSTASQQNIFGTHTQSQIDTESVQNSGR